MLPGLNNYVNMIIICILISPDDVLKMLLRENCWIFSQIHPLCVRPGERAIVDEGKLRQAAQRQPVAQRGHLPGQQQRAHPEDRFAHRHPARQRSPQPGLKR